MPSPQIPALIWTLPLDHLYFLVSSHLRFLSLFSKYYEHLLSWKSREEFFFLSAFLQKEVSYLPASTVIEQSESSAGGHWLWSPFTLYSKMPRLNHFRLNLHPSSTFSPTLKHTCLFNKTYKNKAHETLSPTTSLSLQRQIFWETSTGCGTLYCSSLWPQVHPSPIVSVLHNVTENALAKPTCEFLSA